MFEWRVGGAFMSEMTTVGISSVTSQTNIRKKKSLKQSVRLTEVVIRNLAHVYYEQESRTEPL